MTRTFPFAPYPKGWYCVAVSEELAPGEVRRIDYFGRPLVLFRTEGGESRVFDAHCPHLGAHLGVGGRVVGETLQCPFHAWRFGADGACVEIPYAKRIPPRARVRAWPVRERNGIVLVYHDEEGGEPDWEVPVLEGFEAGRRDGWAPPERLRWTVRTRQQEMAENVVDPPHFRFVHGTLDVPSYEVEEAGHVFRATSSSGVSTPQGAVDGRIEIECHAFGWGFTRFTGVVETLLMTTGTPIDAEHVDLRLAFTVRERPEGGTSGVARAFIDEISRQFSQDIPIWENKVHLERPLLCEGDGPIPALRRWARQFYPDPAVFA